MTNISTYIIISLIVMVLLQKCSFHFCGINNLTPLNESGVVYQNFLFVNGSLSSEDKIWHLEIEAEHSQGICAMG